MNALAALSDPTNTIFATAGWQRPRPTNGFHLQCRRRPLTKTRSAPADGGPATGGQHSDQYNGNEDVEMISIHCRIATPQYDQNTMPDSLGACYQSTTRCPLCCPDQQHLASPLIEKIIHCAGPQLRIIDQEVSVQSGCAGELVKRTETSRCTVRIKV